MYKDGYETFYPLPVIFNYGSADLQLVINCSAKARMVALSPAKLYM